MDLNANEDPNHIDYTKVPIVALRQPARAILSRSLNPIKVLLSEEGIQRDWRGIAHLAGLHSLYGPFITAEKDPMAKVLSLWSRGGDNETANFENLLKFLGDIDRWDVADDLNESLTEDAKAFKSKKYQEQLLIARQEASRACNEFDTDACGNFSPDGNILTIDDVERSQQGLPPQQYDAFLLFADEDIDFATEILDRLEEDHPKFGFKLCVKERNLIGGIPLEHEAILRLISERCDRLIVIVSAAFLKSSANTFFINFAAALQIEQRRRKIIPCLYEPCALPPPLRFYFYLKYFESGRFFNFFDKLSTSIRSPNGFSNESVRLENPLPRIHIEEIKEEEPQKSITLRAPVKIPRKKLSKVPDLLNASSEPQLRVAVSMSQLSSLSVNDNNYPSESDLSLTGSYQLNQSEMYLSQLSSGTKSSSSGKTKWYKMLLPSIKSGSKTSLPVSSSVSIDSVSVSKPKSKKNWLRKRLASNAV